MSLKCLNAQCADHELATADQLAFYQDVGGGWNLSIGPPYDVSKGNLPPHFLLIQHDGDARCKFVVFCNRCRAKLGKVTRVQGFNRLTANFSTKYVRLLPSRDSDLTEKAPKWAAIVDLFPQIRRFTAMKNSRHAKPSGINTEHYRGLEDMQEMIENGRAVAARSNLLPRRYQWRAYFMACLKNVLLCLPLGMGKTLVANMLMLAYRQLNPNKGQVVVVPSVALVEQHADSIRRNTGLRVLMRSSEHKFIPWTENEICVCTAGTFMNALSMKKIKISQLSLLIMDKVYGQGSSPFSKNSCLVSLFADCPVEQRPRILALTSLPSSAASTIITEICNKLDTVPYSPILDDDETDGKPSSVKIDYVEVDESLFETSFELFMFESIESLSHLHDFFKSNWNIVAVCTTSKTKLDCIPKVIKNASLLARNTNDLPLLRLSQLMSKWIDCLLILAIVKPLEVIEVMKADIEFVVENDSLLVDANKLKSVLEEIKAKLNEIEERVEGSADAPRKVELMNQLSIHKEKILVLVETKKIAEKLCRQLKDDPTEFNPECLKTENQHEVMGKFTNGHCQVIIAPAEFRSKFNAENCDVIISLLGAKFLKSFQGGDELKLIAFVTSKELERIEECEAVESSKDDLIRQLMIEFKSSFDPPFLQKVDEFLEVEQGCNESCTGAFSDPYDDNFQELAENLEV